MVRWLDTIRCVENCIRGVDGVVLVEASTQYMYRVGIGMGGWGDVILDGSMIV